MIVAEFRIDHPILRTALERAPSMRLDWQRSDLADGVEWMLVWARGGDHDAFEAGLAADPTVTGPTTTAPVGDGRLYQLRLTEEGRYASAYELLVRECGVVRRIAGSHGWWEVEVGFCERPSICRFVEYLEERDVDVEVRGIAEERGFRPCPSYGLTDPQRETLVAALESGYFEIPRATSLADLADRLDVSENAASERLRRAMAALVEVTVARA